MSWSAVSTMLCRVANIADGLGFGEWFRRTPFFWLVQRSPRGLREEHSSRLDSRWTIESTNATTEQALVRNCCTRNPGLISPCTDGSALGFHRKTDSPVLFIVSPSAPFIRDFNGARTGTRTSKSLSVALRDGFTAGNSVQKIFLFLLRNMLTVEVIRQ